MNLISVIPLTRQKVPENLSYFTASEIPVGAIVSVPLRSKSIHAIVLETRAVMDAKAELRGASFQIRKLGKVKANKFFPVTFMETCSKLATHYASTIGAIMGSVTLEMILDNANKMPPPPGATAARAWASPSAATWWPCSEATSSTRPPTAKGPSLSSPS